MTLQRKLIEALDRPGLRPLLAGLATRYAKRKTGLDVQIFYDDAWMRRAGDCFLAESMTFDWNAAQIAGWKDGLVDFLDMYRDWWFYQYQPKGGDVVVDIGAGIGEDALLFSKSVGREGRVLSVEAHPTTFQLLQKTCQYNRLDNVTSVHCALMDRAGTVHMENRAAYKGNTIAKSSAPSSSQSVEAWSLDELCAQQGIEHIDFLKMNIEGAERLAIQGMQRMIQHTRQLCIACHDFVGEQSDFYRTKALVLDFVRANGFEVTVREEHPDLWVRDHVYGTRTT